MSEFLLGMLVGGGIVTGSLVLARWLSAPPRPGPRSDATRQQPVRAGESNRV